MDDQEPEEITITPHEEAVYPCPCCQAMMKKVAGDYVHETKQYAGFYYSHWDLEHEQGHAKILVAIPQPNPQRTDVFTAAVRAVGHEFVLVWVTDDNDNPMPDTLRFLADREARAHPDEATALGIVKAVVQHDARVRTHLIGEA